MKSKVTGPKCSLSLTVALAGKRRIDPADVADMSETLALVFDAMERRILCSAAGLPRGVPPTSLTLVTGLADGADQIAGRLFLSGAGVGGSKRVLGAVLPCPGDEFARNSPVEDRASFKRAAESCSFITVLRGRLRPPIAACLDTEIAQQARRERGDAFAAQAEALLWDADILVAIDDLNDAGEVGGTRDTLTRAIELRMPVVLLHLGKSGFRLLLPGQSGEERTYLHGNAAREAIGFLVDDTLEIEPAMMSAYA